MNGNTAMSVVLGIEQVLHQPELLGSGRVGLVTNHTGVLPDLTPTGSALLAAGVDLVALFGPEHGVGGSAQDGASEDAVRDVRTGLPVHDTYRRSGAELDRLLRESGVQVLLYDLQDVGARCYTYVWTMYDLMVSAARTSVRFVVADRPNPVGGTLSEGPLLEPGWTSFVGRAEIPLRHGLTCGELAQYVNSTAVAREAGRPADLRVLPLRGWRRADDATATGLPWVPPSPNMPTPDTALVYPGTCLLEGTNLSEGRGTTRPFEYLGAPYLDGRFAAACAALDLPGVRFRELCFVPAFHKYAGEAVHGVHLHVTDRRAFAPVRTAVSLLNVVRGLYPEHFAWRATTDGAEDTEHPHHVDLLWGSDRLRHALDAEEDPLRGCPPPAPPERWAGREALLYD